MTTNLRKPRTPMTLEQRIDYLHDLRKMYEKSVRVHGADSQQAKSMGQALFMSLGFVRGKVGEAIRDPEKVVFVKRLWGEGL